MFLTPAKIAAAVRRQSAWLLLLLCAAGPAAASDHLDTPTVISDPRADIGDLYAWMSPDGRRLNLVMTVVGRAFDDALTYSFHIDSGQRVGATVSTVTLSCHGLAAKPQCSLGADKAQGDFSRPEGVVSARGGFRVFAGQRDDPFFNNVRGTREAYNVVAPLTAAAPRDVAGCPRLDEAASRQMLETWRQTSGGPAQNFLAGWAPASLVVSIDVARVSTGGRLLAVWSDTARDGRRIDRAGRPLTGNALLGLFAPTEDANAMKERFNRAAPSDAAAFAPEIEKGLAIYDAFDGACGDALLARPTAGASRYLEATLLLADDRLWIDSARTRCTTLFAVELAARAARRNLGGDCGGRAPNHDAVDVYRSLLVGGTLTGVSDGVDQDDGLHSDTAFPFLAPPTLEAGK